MPTIRETRGSLSSTFAPLPDAEWWGSLLSIQYDGTDETATVNAALATIATAGGGTLHLESLVRCDGQVTIPTTLSGYQLRQPPIRITGTVQTQPGSTFSEATPYATAGGLDLRYAGRTDAGCSTTAGSAIVLNPSAVAGDRGLIVTGAGIPDQAWVLAVDPGVSWTLYRPARATAASVSLTVSGARIQTYGYGTLELDHLQLVSGGTSSAPMVGTTATTLNAHDNLIAGMASKTLLTCDEDAFTLGGPGQGVRLTSALTSGQVYTSLAVSALPVPITSGRKLLIGAGTAGQQEVTIASAGAAGDTSIAVNSFTAGANHEVSDSVWIGYAQSQIHAASWSVPSCPFQGYGTVIEQNHFHRIRRISLGGFASSVSIRKNSWMHNCGSNLATAPSTLTTGLTAGATVTSLAVTALSRAVNAGDIIQTGVGLYSQEWVASSAAAAGATSISVTSDTADYTLAIGTKVINTTAGIGAAVESYAIASEVNAPVVAENRVGMIGYTHATRFSGATQQGVITANDMQDIQAATAFVALHRFGRFWSWGASYNLVVVGLSGAGAEAVDDWSTSDGRPTQTVIAHDQGRNSYFPQGIATVAESSVELPMGPTATFTRSAKALIPDGSYWRTRAETDYTTWEHSKLGAASAVVARLTNAPAGTSTTFTMYGTTYGRVDAANGDLRLVCKTGSRVYLGDAASPTSVYVLGGRVYAPSIQVTPVATGSRPSASTVGAGTMIYDSTLSKPVWSDGTTWRDAAGTEV